MHVPGTRCSKLNRVKLNAAFCRNLGKTFPRKVRGTADPSTSLGMTKEMATVSWKVVAGPVHFLSPWVGRLPQGNENASSFSGQSSGNGRPFLCHPERTRISYFTALNGATCVVLPKENHMQLIEAATLDRKSGEAEGSAVPRTFRGNAGPMLKENCHLDCPGVPWDRSVPGFPATQHSKRLNPCPSSRAFPYLRKYSWLNADVARSFRLKSHRAAYHYGTAA